MEDKLVEEEKLFEAVHMMSDGTVEMHNQFMRETEEFKERCKIYSSILENEAKIKPCSGVSAALKEYSNMMQVRYNKNCENLDMLQGEINKLNTSRKHLIDELNGKEKKITAIKQKLSNLEKRRNSLQSKRDQIEAFKLLTNIDFCFEDESVSGYAANKNTRKISSFNMNPQKLSQKEIIDKLYEIIFDVSSEDQ